MCVAWRHQHECADDNIIITYATHFCFISLEFTQRFSFFFAAYFSRRRRRTHLQAHSSHRTHTEQLFSRSCDDNNHNKFVHNVVLGNGAETCSDDSAKIFGVSQTFRLIFPNYPQVNEVSRRSAALPIAFALKPVNILLVRMQ